MGENHKREMIIRAAQEILAEKGLRESTIADIARRANVFDSVIYRHFKNKEDLLFWSLAEKVKEVMQDLTFQFSGIIGAAAKLSKMVWFHLYLNDFKAGPTRVIKNLLFECRSNKNFYDHEGYNALRKYTGIMMSILQEGVDNGTFRRDFSIHLVRDMIFGFIDEESISCLLMGEVEETIPDFESIMSLIFAMVQSSPNAPTSEENPEKAARIIEAATRVFAAKGYEKATMVEVANEAKVAEGTIYEYFKNKEELLFSISEQRFEAQKEHMERRFESEDPMAKLQRMIYYYFNFLLADPKFAIVFLNDTKLNKQFYSTKAYSYFLNYISALNELLDEGKSEGAFRPDIDNRVFRNLFLGSFSHLTVRWFVLGKTTPISMMEELNEVTSLLCRSITNR